MDASFIHASYAKKVLILPPPLYKKRRFNGLNGFSSPLGDSALEWNPTPPVIICTSYLDGLGCCWRIRLLRCTRFIIKL